MPTTQERRILGTLFHYWDSHPDPVCASKLEPSSQDHATTELLEDLIALYGWSRLQGLLNDALAYQNVDGQFVLIPKGTS